MPISPAHKRKAAPTAAASLDRALARWDNEGGRPAAHSTPAASPAASQPAPAAAEPPTIWTIGHSTRTIEEFIDLLHGSQIALLADVRSHPGSRKYPHFNQGPLADALRAEGIDYQHFPDLGGRRKARPDSPNTAWRNASFRGYADYMQTPPYRAGIERLGRAARSARTAIMCSEAVWWRCHRSMIADDLKAAGVRVLHIVSATKVQEHPYTSAARIIDGRLSYTAGLFDPPPSDPPPDSSPHPTNEPLP